MTLLQAIGDSDQRKTTRKWKPGVAGDGESEVKGDLYRFQYFSPQKKIPDPCFNSRLST